MQKEYIETKRLILRKFKEDDALLMYTNWASDPEVTKYLLWDTHSSIEETRRILKLWMKEYEDPKTNRYCITIKGSDEPLGSIDIVRVESGVPELGYCLSKKCWNKGYMTEAVKALIEDIFKDGYEKICICAYKDNIGSNRVIQKCGFTFIKEFKMIVKNKEVTVNYYLLEK